MAFRIETKPSINSHYIGFFQFSHNFVGIETAGTFYGTLQHINCHVAAGSAQAFRLNSPFFGIGFIKFHCPRGGIGWRIAGVDDIAKGVFALTFSGFPKTGLLCGGKGGAEGKRRNLHIIPLFQQNGAFRHVHPDIDNFGFGPFGFQQSHGKIGSAGGIYFYARDVPPFF